MIKRFHQVDDGIFRGSAPNPDDVQFLKNQHGVKKIISLDKETGEEIEEACKNFGVEHKIIPLDGTRKSFLHLLSENIEKLLKEGGPVFIHCHHGKDRTGLLTALYRCKVQGKHPEAAIKEAYDHGFGISCEPEFIDMIEKIIRACKKEKLDENDADIVSNVRDYVSDNRSSILDEAHQGSFAPYLSITRQWPYDPVYSELQNQSPTRENLEEWKKEKPIFPHSKKETAPQVGQYNNNAGINGAGPTIPVGGFIGD